MCLDRLFFKEVLATMVTLIWQTGKALLFQLILQINVRSIRAKGTKGPKKELGDKENFFFLIVLSFCQRGNFWQF